MKADTLRFTRPLFRGHAQVSNEKHDEASHFPVHADRTSAREIIPLTARGMSNTRIVR